MTTGKELATVSSQVAKVSQEIALADALVEQVLIAEVDYGLHPGTSSWALKDPGASTIINAFGCYVRAEVLFREVSDIRISYVINVELVDRRDDSIKATGTGACTTQETKYGYRWVTDPEAWGYERTSLRHRRRNGEDQYRVTNPEWSELENTILKMARKRAEGDAAQGLPGVARFIARLNAKKPAARQPADPSLDWTSFWSRARAMGLDDKHVHQCLKVKSMKDWTDQGKTLNDAIREISRVIAGTPPAEEG